MVSLAASASILIKPSMILLLDCQVVSEPPSKKVHADTIVVDVDVYVPQRKIFLSKILLETSPVRSEKNKIHHMIASFGRTDLRRDVSGENFDAESYSEVRSAVAPPKPKQNSEKPSFRSKIFAKAFFFGVKK